MDNNFIKERDKKIEQYSKEIEEPYQTKEEKKEEIEEIIIKYARNNPSFVKKFFNIFTSKSEILEKRKNRFINRYKVVIIGGALSLGMGLGASVQKGLDKRDNLEFKKEYSSIYDDVSTAPNLIKDSYASEQQHNYYASLEKDPSLKNEEFEDAYRAYEKERYENPKSEKLGELADNLEYVASYDNNPDTVPFKASTSSYSIIRDGEVYVPVASEDELKEDTVVINEDGSLYRKVRGR